MCRFQRHQKAGLTCRSNVRSHGDSVKFCIVAECPRWRKRICSSQSPVNGQQPVSKSSTQHFNTGTGAEAMNRLFKNPAVSSEATSNPSRF